MSPRQRMLAARLSEKLARNTEYAKSIGIVISNKNDCREKSNKSFPKQSVR